MSKPLVNGTINVSWAIPPSCGKQEGVTSPFLYYVPTNKYRTEFFMFLTFYLAYLILLLNNLEVALRFFCLNIQKLHHQLH